MQEAKDFLHLMGLELPTFQTFCDVDAPQHVLKKLAAYRTAPFDHAEGWLKQMNRRRAGVYVMPNQGDGRGRSAKNVTKINAYFADLDGAPLPHPDHMPLLPTVIVNTSPGKYHLYWRVDNAPLETFSHVQKHLSVVFASDDKVIDVCRVMRLPGFFHMKGEPYRVTIENASGIIYDAQEVLDVFSVPKPLAPLPRAAQAYLDSRSPKKGSGLRSHFDAVAKAGEGSRNDTLFRRSAALANDVARGELDENEYMNAMIAAGVASGLSESESKNTVISARRYATIN